MATAIYTDTGQAHSVDALDPATRAALSSNYYVAWGSGEVPAAVTDTSLGAEASEARVSAAVSQPATNVIQYVGTITATVSHIDTGAGEDITEAGVFDASTAGGMLLRGTHPGLNIETGDKVEYTFTLTFSDGSV